MGQIFGGNPRTIIFDQDEGFGVGLGLSTVYGIMEYHKGTINVESHPGEGATFFLRLPLA